MIQLPNLPEPVQWVSYAVAGDRFPAGNEDLLSELADLWQGLGETLAGSEPALAAALEEISSAYGGAAGMEFLFAAMDLRGFGRAGGGLRDLVQASLQQHMTLRMGAMDIALTKAMIVMEVIATAFAVWWAIISSKLSLGLSGASIPALIQAGRSRTGQLFGKLVARLSSLGGSHTFRRFTPAGARVMLLEGAQEIGEETFIAAGGQLLAGREVDWGMVVRAGMAGFAGGVTGTAIFGPNFFGLGNRFQGRGIRQGGFRPVAGAALLAAGQNPVSSGLGGIVAETALGEGWPGIAGAWDMIYGGALGAALVGAVRGGATRYAGIQGVRTSPVQIDPVTGLLTPRSGGRLDPLAPETVALLTQAQHEIGAALVATGEVIPHPGVATPAGAGIATGAPLPDGASGAAPSLPEGAGQRPAPSLHAGLAALARGTDQLRVRIEYSVADPDGRLHIGASVVDESGRPVGSQTRVLGQAENGSWYVEEVSTLLATRAVMPTADTVDGDLLDDVDSLLAQQEAALGDLGFSELRRPAGALAADAAAARGVDFAPDVPLPAAQLRGAFDDVLAAVQADPRHAILELLGVDPGSATDHARADALLDQYLAEARLVRERLAGEGWQQPTVGEILRSGPIGAAALSAVGWAGVKPIGTADRLGGDGRAPATAEPGATPAAPGGLPSLADVTEIGDKKLAIEVLTGQELAGHRLRPSPAERVAGGFAARDEMSVWLDIHAGRSTVGEVSVELVAESANSFHVRATVSGRPDLAEPAGEFVAALRERIEQWALASGLESTGVHTSQSGDGIKVYLAYRRSVPVERMILSDRHNRVDLLTTVTGRSVVRKAYQGDNPGVRGRTEYLLATVAKRLGLDATPEVRPPWPADTELRYVYLDHVESMLFFALDQAEQDRLLDSGQGRLLGLFHLVMGDLDRNSENLRAVRSGGGYEVMPLDHEMGFDYGDDPRLPPSPSILDVFSLRYVEFSDGGPRWADNDLAPPDIDHVREVLERLRPEFARLNASEPLDHALARLDEIAKHAKGTRPWFAAEAAQAAETAVDDRPDDDRPDDDENGPTGATGPAPDRPPRSPGGAVVRALMPDGPRVPGHGGPAPTGPTTPAELQTGVPIERIPGTEALARYLNQLLDPADQVTEEQVDGMIRGLYRDVVSPDGYLFTLGTAHQRTFHIRLRLTNPVPVESEVVPVEQIQRSLGQSLRGMVNFLEWTGQSSLALSGEGEWVSRLLPVRLRLDRRSELRLRVGGKLYAEAGLGAHDNRGPGTVVAADVAVEVTERDRHNGGSGSSTHTIRPGDPALLAVPDPYLAEVPPTVRIGQYPGRVPAGVQEFPHVAVLRMTGKIAVVDEIVGIITRAGHRGTSNLREQVWQLVVGLPDSLTAAARNRNGHHFVVNDRGRTFYIQLVAEIHRENARMVGAEGDRVYIEQVGVGWVRTLGNSAAVRLRRLGLVASGRLVRWLSADAATGREVGGGPFAGRDSIQVTVDRQGGPTVAEEIGNPDNPEREPGVVYKVLVFDTGGSRLGRAEVNGTLVIRTTLRDAWIYGLPVPERAVDERGDLIHSGRPEKDTAEPDLAYPSHLVQSGSDGLPTLMLGMAGTVRDFRLDHPTDVPPVPSPDGVPPGRVDGDAVSSLRDAILMSLRGRGFGFDVYLAPGGPARFASGRRGYRTPDSLDLRLLNQRLLEEQLIQPTLETLYDRLIQGGISLRLARFRSAAREQIEMIDIAIRLVVDVDKTEFLGRTRDREIVHLAIDSYGGGAERAASQLWGLGVSGGGGGFRGGLEGSWRTVTTASRGQRGNVVHLFEYNGDVAAWRVPHTLQVRFLDEAGNAVPGLEPIRLHGGAEIYQPADFVPDDRPPPVVAETTSADLFRANTAVVTSIWAPELVDAAKAVLPTFPEAWGTKDVIHGLASVDMVGSAFKEIVTDGVRTDQLVRTGFGPRQQGALQIRAELGDTTLLGVTDHVATGHFMFRMASHLAGAGSARSWSAGGGIPALKARGPAKEYAGRRVRESGRNRERGQVYGLERIPISAGERYFHLRTNVTFRVDGTTARRSYGRNGRPSSTDVTPRSQTATGAVTWVLAEPDVIEAYGNGLLDLPAGDVATSLRRWVAGETMLDRAVVSRAVLRLVTTHPGAADPELLRVVLRQYAEPGPPERLRELARRLPEYLRAGHGLGYSTIDALEVRDPDGRRPNQALVELVKRVAPGLIDGLTAGGDQAGEVVAHVGDLPGLRMVLDALTAGDRLRGPLDSMVEGADWYPLWSGEVPVGGDRGRRGLLTVEARARINGPVAVVGHRTGLVNNQAYHYGDHNRIEGSSVGWTGTAAGVAGLGEVASGRGRDTAAVRNSQYTRIGLQESGATLLKVAADVEVEFRVRRVSAPGIGPGGVRRGGPPPWAATTLTGRLTLLVPEESLARPVPHQTHTGTLGWLPDRHGVDHVAGRPVRELVTTLLRRAVGRDAVHFEPGVAAVYSADKLRPGFAAYLPDGGETILLDGRRRPERTAQVNLQMRLTELTVLGEMPNFTLGAEERQQELFTDVEGAPLGRPLELAAGHEFGNEGGRPGVRVSAGEQARVGVESASGIRQEESAKEAGPAVLLKVRYAADAEVTAYERRLGTGLAQLGPPRRGSTEGVAYLRVFQRDLPELIRRLESPHTPPSGETMAAGEAGQPEPAVEAVRDPGHRAYRALRPGRRPRWRRRVVRVIVAGAALAAAARGGDALVRQLTAPDSGPADPHAEPAPDPRDAPDDPVVITRDPAAPRAP